jgi:hypothetical protein
LIFIGAKPQIIDMNRIGSSNIEDLAELSFHSTGCHNLQTFMWLRISIVVSTFLQHIRHLLNGCGRFFEFSVAGFETVLALDGVVSANENLILLLIDFGSTFNLGFVYL